MDEILDRIAATNQEVYREKALALFGVLVPLEDNPKRLMQKAYLKYSTISSVKGTEEEPVARSRWQEQISYEHKFHAELITKLTNGERVEGIEKDPLAEKTADVAYDYSSIPGFVKREQSVVGDDKLRVQPHPESLKNVEKMLKKLKEGVKKNKAQEQQEEEEEEVLQESEVVIQEEEKHEENVVAQLVEE